VFAFAVSSSKLLYFSNTCIFLNNISSILSANKVIADPNVCIAYIDSKNYIFSNIKLLESTNYSSLIYDEICNSVNCEINDLISIKSSSIQNKKFDQMKGRISACSVIAFDTFKLDVSDYSKINQIWLHKNHETLKMLQKPRIFKKSESLPPTLVEKTNNLDVLKISIIIPAFKAAEYIEECLNSIYSQNTVFTFEILIGIDNCESTKDKLLQIADKYSNLHIFYSNESVGPYIIRNTLVQKATYPNLLFFDADDIMSTSLISNISRKNDQVRPIRFKYFNFNQGSDPFSSKTIHHTTGEGVFFIPKGTFKKIGGFQNWKVGADSEFKQRCNKNKILSIELSEPLFYRRLHNSSLTQDARTGYNSALRLKILNKIKNNKDWKIPISPVVTPITKLTKSNP